MTRKQEKKQKRQNDQERQEQERQEQLALEAYAVYYNLPPDVVTVEQMLTSSAGIDWRQFRELPEYDDQYKAWQLHWLCSTAKHGRRLHADPPSDQTFDLTEEIRKIDEACARHLHDAPEHEERACSINT